MTGATALGTRVEQGASAPTSPARVVVLGITLVCAWVLLRSGPGLVPGVESHEALARAWPLSEVTPLTAYVLRLPLGQVLYAALPVEGLRVFVALHVAALGLAAALLVTWLLRRYGSQPGAIATTVLLLSPLPAVLVEWIGIYDAFSVLAWVLVILTLPTFRGLQAAAAVVAGLQNFEQVAVGIVLLALLPELSRAVGWRPWVPGLLAGALAGRVALEVYLASVGATGGSRLTFMLENPDLMGDMIRSFWVNLPLVAASVLGGLWVFAVPVLQRAWREPTRALRARLVLVAALVVAVGTLGADHTRVIVLSSVPLLVAGAVVVGRQSPTYGDFWRRPEAWVLLLFPPLVSFGDVLLDLGVRHSGWGPF